LFDKMILWTTSDQGHAWQVSLQLLVRASSDPALAAVFQKRYARFRRNLASRLAKAQAQGTVRKDFSADLLADQISAIGDGWALMFPGEPARFSRAAASRSWWIWRSRCWPLHQARTPSSRQHLRAFSKR
jgi:TetR/AcrR family transcriptional regulator, transcriptional repressor of aconitase